MTTATDTTANGATAVRLPGPKRIALACGQHKTAGFFGVDIAEVDGVDMVLDLLPVPWKQWPIRDNCATEIVCEHFVEHIPHHRPGWEKDGWWLFFDEVYRICKPGATLRFVHPYCMSGRAFWDPTHERFIHETTWAYLSREWREKEHLDHYPTNVNFEVVSIDGAGVTDEFMLRSEQQQAFARAHYWNVIADVAVTLKALK